MVIRSIYCKEEQLEDVRMVLDVVIPNDYYIFINKWKVVKTPGLSGICIDLELENQEDWSKLKKRYFPNYKKPALPGSIILEDTKEEYEKYIDRAEREDDRIDYRAGVKEGYLTAVKNIISAFEEVEEAKINRETILKELKELYAVKDVELDVVR